MKVKDIDSRSTETLGSKTSSDIYQEGRSTLHTAPRNATDSCCICDFLGALDHVNVHAIGKQREPNCSFRGG